MTLDQAAENFFADGTIKSLADYLRVAREYEGDGMISTEELLDVLAIVNDHLDHLAEEEKK